MPITFQPYRPEENIPDLLTAPMNMIKLKQNQEQMGLLKDYRQAQMQQMQMQQQQHEDKIKQENFGTKMKYHQNIHEYLDPDSQVQNMQDMFDTFSNFTGEPVTVNTSKLKEFNDDMKRLGQAQKDGAPKEVQQTLMKNMWSKYTTPKQQDILGKATAGMGLGIPKEEIKSVVGPEGGSIYRSVTGEEEIPYGVASTENKANLQYVGVSNDKDKAPVVFDPDSGGTFKNINGQLIPYSGQVEPKIEKQTTTIITPGQTATIAHGIRTEMRGNPIVRDYQEVVQKYHVMEEALKASQTTKNFVAVDQALITLFNKMTDPTSVVRESEYARTAQNLSLINRIKGKAYKILEGGAGLTQDERNAITDMGRTFYKTYEKEYKFTVNNYKRMAKESGINPDLVSIPYERPPTEEQKTVVKTGTDKKTGKKVIQYSDGSIEYAQ